jgi:hypothetical protein
MKLQISTARPVRLQFGFAFPARRLRPPNPPFRDTAPLAPDLDEGCWIAATGGAAIEIRSIVDHREDAE